MKRTFTVVASIGTATCRLPDGRELVVPVVPGIFKHPAADSLPALLSTPTTLRKYTAIALRIAPWPVLRLFPAWWLLECMEAADLSDGRRRALYFLLPPRKPGEDSAPRTDEP